MMAPVTISASVLTLRATILLGALACSIITFLVVFHLPLRLATGEEVTPPGLLTVGTWASLVIGVVFLAAYARRVTEETFSMSQALSATQMALGREQQIAALGGVVAAAAHELGTPLATIRLVATELAEELRDRPEAREDALLIGAQADRCRDILRAMGTHGHDDALVHHAPFSSVIDEAAAPHADRGIRIITRIEGALAEDVPPIQPEVLRRPEIIQGLRNLIQNAVDFARTTVWIDLDWTPADLRVAIGDDGPGYPPDLFGRIGEPFVRVRPAPNPPPNPPPSPAQTAAQDPGPAAARPGYEGMGLGLFIAKTLLERTGAELRFYNGSDDPAAARLAGPVEFSRPTGAVVAVTWPRARIAVDPAAARGPLGPNLPA
jgi:two-component system sensor histidine kinase RegB